MRRARGRAAAVLRTCPARRATTTAPIDGTPAWRHPPGPSVPHPLGLTARAPPGVAAQGVRENALARECVRRVQVRPHSPPLSAPPVERDTASCIRDHKRAACRAPAADDVQADRALASSEGCTGSGERPRLELVSCSLTPKCRPDPRRSPPSRIRPGCAMTAPLLCDLPISLRIRPVRICSLRGEREGVTPCLPTRRSGIESVSCEGAGISNRARAGARPHPRCAAASRRLSAL